jgi:alkylation response protein AidB-like acyl-CoA dehydrogenase
MMTNAMGTAWGFRQAALDLIPQLRKRADGAERERRLPVETIANLRDLGLLRAFVPRTYGGDERALSEVLDVMTELGAGCASTAWVGSLVAIHNVAVCWLEKKGQDEIFGEGPDVVLTSSVAPTGTLIPVAGGFELLGKWGFSSGVDHASWVVLGASLKAEGAPGEYFLCFVRASEVMMIDDWHVSGLRATGSKSLELGNVFVPNHRALLLRSVREGTAAGLRLHASPFYRLPWDSLFISAFPPAALGTAVAMLEGFREYTATRISRFSGRGFRTNSGSAMRMAAAAAEIDAARLVFRRDLVALDRLAREGRPLFPGTAERISYDVPFVIDACSRAVHRLFRGSGGRALYDGNPFQRYFRDIHAMTQHAVMDMDGAGETYGRSLFQNPTLAVGARE